MILNIEEIFGFKQPNEKEIEPKKTNNFDDLFDPNWSSVLSRFEMGLFNAKESTASDLITEKLNLMNSSIMNSSILKKIFEMLFFWKVFNLIFKLED